MRAGYAAPLFSAFAFLVAAGLSLEGSPFCERIRDEVTRVTRPANVQVVRTHDPSWAGTYDTFWGRVELHANGIARAHAGKDGNRLVEGTWHLRDGALVVEWLEGSFVLAQEWWQRPASTPASTSPTCTGGSC